MNKKNVFCPNVGNGSRRKKSGSSGGGVGGGGCGGGGTSSGSSSDGIDIDNHKMSTVDDRAQSNEPVKSDRAQSNDPVKSDHRVREFLNGELCIDAR